MRRMRAPLMSKYSVSSTMDTPTTFTVTTRHTASLREFQTYLPMEPARKKRMTAKASRSPAALRVLKMLVSVLRQGRSMKPKNR